MNFDWARQSGMEKPLEMTRPKRSRRVWVGDELAIDWLSDAPKPSEFGVAARERKGGCLENRMYQQPQRCGSAKTVFVSQHGNGGGWEPRGPFRLAGSSLTRNMCLALRMQHDIFRCQTKKNIAVTKRVPAVT